jgi:hypothetical protein
MKDEYREMLAQQRTNLLKAVLTQKWKGGSQAEMLGTT